MLKSFYIYDWPDSVVDLWPLSYNHHRLSFSSPNYRSNGGFGSEVEESIGLYSTHQYSLFTIFYERLKQSKYRVMDPSKADWFFIPYDLGMDGNFLLPPSTTMTNSYYLITLCFLFLNSEHS